MTNEDKTAIFHITENLTDAREKLEVLCIMFAGDCDIQACASGLYTITNEVRATLEDVNDALVELKSFDAE